MVSQSTVSQEAKLIVSPTPIGNLEDVTLRVLRALKEADYVVAEDTRETKKLLNRYKIETSMLSYHQRNEVQRMPELLAKLRAGRTLALVSDAGTPGLSDPGHRLIVACIEEGIKVEVLPGPAAAITALVASGLPTSSFVYHGFLPRRRGERRKLLEELIAFNRTLVLFEAPHRLAVLLGELDGLVPDREVVVARELTKRFEEIRRGRPRKLLEHFGAARVRGELVVLVAPGEIEPVFGDVRADVLALIAEGVPKKTAISLVAARRRLPKRVVYEETKEIHRA